MNYFLFASVTGMVSPFYFNLTRVYFFESEDTRYEKLRPISVPHLFYLTNVRFL